MSEAINGEVFIKQLNFRNYCLQIIRFKNFFLFLKSKVTERERKRERARERGRERKIFHPLDHFQTIAIARDGSGQSQEPRIPSLSPM